MFLCFVQRSYPFRDVCRKIDKSKTCLLNLVLGTRRAGFAARKTLLRTHNTSLMKLTKEVKDRIEKEASDKYGPMSKGYMPYIAGATAEALDGYNK